MLIKKNQDNGFYLLNNNKIFQKSSVFIFCIMIFTVRLVLVFHAGLFAHVSKSMYLDTWIYIDMYSACVMRYSL